MKTNAPATAPVATIPLQAQSLPEFTQALIAVCEHLQKKITLNVHFIVGSTVQYGDYCTSVSGDIAGCGNIIGQMHNGTINYNELQNN